MVAETELQEIITTWKSRQRGDRQSSSLTDAMSLTTQILDGSELYAWCALDTLFLPDLMGRSADVESTCPVTGQEIQLTVAPDHIESSNPDGIVVSIIIPGEADGTGEKSISGPQCAT